MSNSGFQRERAEEFYRLIRHDHLCHKGKNGVLKSLSLSITLIQNGLCKRCTEVFDVHARTHEQDTKHTANLQPNRPELKFRLSGCLRVSVVCAQCPECHL